MGTLVELGLDAPAKDLVELCRNPLNLDIVARLIAAGNKVVLAGDIEEFSLWDRFVQVVEAEDHVSAHRIGFGEHLVAEGVRFARQVLISSVPDFLVNDPPTNEQRRLHSWGIIELIAGHRYRFRHDKFRDYLYAKDCVNRGIMAPAIVQELPKHHATAVLLLAYKLYLHTQSPLREEFLQGYLNG